MINRLVNEIYVYLLGGLVISSSKGQRAVILIEVEVVARLLPETFARDYRIPLFAVSSKPQSRLNKILVDDIAKLAVGMNGFVGLLAGDDIELEGSFYGWRLEERVVVRNRNRFDFERVLR